jgi:hypothetical protein
MDISADLIELGRMPVAAVCASVKFILDIWKTLEFLVCQIFKIFRWNSILSSVRAKCECSGAASAPPIFLASFHLGPNSEGRIAPIHWSKLPISLVSFLVH